MQNGSRGVHARLRQLAPLAFFALGAAAGLEAAGEPRETLHLVLVDLSGMPPALARGALDEVAELLRPLALRVTSEISPPRERSGRRAVQVTLLPLDRSRDRAHAAGGVALPAYDGTHTVWAFPPKLARTLGVELGRFARWTNRQRQEFHRALAVVIVHELAHALAGASHQPAGLMSARLPRRDLLESRLALDPGLHAALRAGVRRLAPAQAATDGAGPEARGGSGSTPRRALRQGVEPRVRP
jgi:hypothetical protein